MKIVVIGGTGLIGSKLINLLTKKGHEAIAASPSKGVNTLTGDGLKEVLKGANVVVDVANSPSFEDKAVLEFFEKSSKNILSAAKNAKISHYVALSIVGVDLLSENGYFRAKVAQEKLITSSQIPYTIVRATQFFEFLESIAQASTTGQTVHLPSAFLQPIAAEDVAAALFEVVLDKPLNGIIEIAGPERFRITDIVKKYLKAAKDSRLVVCDEETGYFGAKLEDDTLVPHEKNPHLGKTNFESWFDHRK